MRLFVALPLPSDHAAALAELQCGLPGARWNDFGNFHLTLAFLGEMAPTAAAALSQSLADIDLPAFSVEFDGIVRFGGRRGTTSAIWAGVRPSEPLLALRRAVRRRIEDAGQALERRRFRPHVTLGRFRGADRFMAEYLAGVGLVRAAAWSVDRFALYRSRVSSEGSVYTVLHSWRLRTERPCGEGSAICTVPALARGRPGAAAASDAPSQAG